jgi:hypothetical protein
MRKVFVLAACVALLATTAWAARIDQASLTTWASAASLPGYTFGGVEETDPGVYMMVWMSAKQEMIGVHVYPASEFKKNANQTVNKRKPQAITYNGSPATYTDALAPTGTMSVAYEKAGKTLVISNMGQPRALTKEEFSRILDGLAIDKLFK